MAENDGTAPMPRLVSDMDALEDAYEQHVDELLAHLQALLARHGR